MLRSHLRPSTTQKISGPDGYHSRVESFIRDDAFPTEGGIGRPVTRPILRTWAGGTESRVVESGGGVSSTVAGLCGQLGTAPLMMTALQVSIGRADIKLSPLLGSNPPFSRRSFSTDWLPDSGRPRSA
jgi:hypothetical protein